jgi:ribosomal protein S18 acetylase RimI-like enzyme
MKTAQIGMEIIRLASEIRDNATSYQSNLFADEAKVDFWIADEQKVKYVVIGNSLFIFREDRGFFHIYFCSSSQDDLDKDLADLQPQSAAWVVDLVGNHSQINSLENLFSSHNFSPYASLKRLVLSAPAAEGKPDASYVGHENVELAALSDADQLLKLLETSFDPLKEQIPFKRELVLGIEKGSILVVRKDQVLAGLLYHETMGITSILRYWLVSEHYRNRGIGSVLMSRYLSLYPNVKRFMLWVLTDNVDAISKYRHYGFKEDSLVDIVMIRGAN